MPDIARRFPENPLLHPNQLIPSQERLQIISLLNPGVFRYQNKTWLVVRVAEGVRQSEGIMYIPRLTEDGLTEIIGVPLTDPDLLATDARIIRYKGLDYLTTLSHLRLMSSLDGIHFAESPDYPPILSQGPLETYGLEDCRVTHIGPVFHLTYTAVSPSGVCVGYTTTLDWQHFSPHELMLPPHNKDCTLFDENINGLYYAMHRPSSLDIGGNYIWVSQSPDCIHWGRHQCLLKTRPGAWDSERVGAGAAPIKTNKGWLAIYHGANARHEYCLGAFLVDLDNPGRLLARTAEPIMSPREPYELSGFFGYVVFTNGHVCNGDLLTIYYGAADEFVCGAHFSIMEILSHLTYL